MQRWMSQMKKPHRVGGCIVYQHVKSCNMDLSPDADTHKFDISNWLQLIMLTGIHEALCDCGPNSLKPCPIGFLAVKFTR